MSTHATSWLLSQLPHTETLIFSATVGFSVWKLTQQKAYKRIESICAV